MDSNYLNRLFEKYSLFSEKISKQYNYDSNICHLLSVIIPAFIIKYGFKNERVILNCFENTRIVSGNISSKNVHAFYDRKIVFNDEIKTIKYIVVNELNDKNYIMYLDTLIHEFNHAVNSINKEIGIDSNKLFLRTGLSYSIYNIENNLTGKIAIGVGKSNDFILEEIINTKQTEEIIDIILGFNNNNIDNIEINNFLSAIVKELNNSKYKSNSYYYLGQLCNKLLESKTFYKTIEKLRFSGDILEISNWFDGIIGIDKEYDKLNQLMLRIYELEKKYEQSIFFKNRIIKQIKRYSNEIVEIVSIFVENSVY